MDDNKHDLSDFNFDAGGNSKVDDISDLSRHLLQEHSSSPESAIGGADRIIDHALYDAYEIRDVRKLFYYNETDHEILDADGTDLEETQVLNVNHNGEEKYWVITDPDVQKADDDRYYIRGEEAEIVNSGDDVESRGSISIVFDSDGNLKSDTELLGVADPIEAYSGYVTDDNYYQLAEEANLAWSEAALINSREWGTNQMKPMEIRELLPGSYSMRNPNEVLTILTETMVAGPNHRRDVDTVVGNVNGNRDLVEAWLDVFEPSDEAREELNKYDSTEDLV